MSESSFWDYLRVLLPKDIHYSRIESDVCPGFPDVHYTLKGVSGAIELKDAKLPAGKYPFSGSSGLRDSQLAWIDDELEANGRVLLALQKHREVYILQANLWYRRLSTMALREIEAASLLRWRKGEQADDLTKQLYDILVSR